MELKCQKHLFSLDEKQIYLNGAYMSPMLKLVEEAGMKGMLLKRNPIGIPSEKFFTEEIQLKSLVSDLLNIEDGNRICTIPSASYGLANVANNVKVEKSQSVCLLSEQFPSNYYTWKELADRTGAHLKIIQAPQDLYRRGQNWNELILDALTDEVAVISMGHIHWADGTKFDLPAIRARCNEIGALLIIDGTQSIGALPFDQKLIQADAIICASYKWLFGPYSIGIAYYGDRFDDGIPIEESWINRRNSQDFKNLVNYEDTYRPGAQKYGVGESSNFILLPMMNEAIRQLLRWEPAQFQKYCREISIKAIEKLLTAGFWVEEEDFRAHHLFGVAIPEKMSLPEIRTKLLEAHISVSLRGNFIRISPSVYNDEDEMIKFAKCLSDVV